jgi:hypothetical protein
MSLGQKCWQTTIFGGGRGVGGVFQNLGEFFGDSPFIPIKFPTSFQMVINVPHVSPKNFPIAQHFFIQFALPKIAIFSLI